MGNSCACIKDANQNEVESIVNHTDKISVVIKIQKAIRGFLARKRYHSMKQQKFLTFGEVNHKKMHSGKSYNANMNLD